MLLPPFLRYVLGAALLLTLVACKPPEQRMAEIAAIITAPAGGRGPAALEIVAAFKKKELQLGDALDAANRHLDAVSSGAVKSVDATALAGAVLDAAAILDPQLPHQGEMEIFWISVGRVAFRAAEEAHANGRIAEAMTLALAGPQRWQNDAYWNRYSDHDGLVALLLAKSGRQAEAISRLQNRPDLRGVALEVYELLTKGPPQ